MRLRVLKIALGMLLFSNALKYIILIAKIRILGRMPLYPGDGGYHPVIFFSKDIDFWFLLFTGLLSPFVAFLIFGILMFSLVEKRKTSYILIFLSLVALSLEIGFWVL